jgi:ABC-3C biological conflict system middle component
MVTVAPSVPPLSEIEIVQNPALGAYSIWRFGLGFQSEDSRPAAFPLAFLVLPLLLHRPTLSIIASTQRASGLALFAAKLGQERENLLAVHERALALRQLTLQSIAMGIDERLLTVDYVSASIRSNTPDTAVRKPILPERIKSFSGAAEKIGYWFSKLGLHQIASTLAVEF